MFTYYKSELSNLLNINKKRREGVPSGADTIYIARPQIFSLVFPVKFLSSDSP